ncbi:MAG: response regulator transcription factor [Clostridia bacterium]|nr:response regulator transcription factor [Clostridia bacterium]
MNKILIIEDEEKIARFVELELEHEGYEADKANDGRTGLEMAETGNYDLIVLDIMLPQLSGIEVLRRLRKSANEAAANVPVILLTARDAITDKVTGLDMGANDYMTKPFAIEELLARIRAALRQSQNAVRADGHRDDILRAAGIELNVSAHTVTFHGKTVDFTNREFILLRTLMENKNTAMSREKLLAAAWGYDYYGETNIVDVYVRYIRQKTDDGVIKTIRGVGYMVEGDR